MAASPSVERLELPSAADLGAVAELRAALLARLDAGRAVNLDASPVAEPTTALVQLIESAASAFATKDLKVGLIAPSDALCSAYEDLGLFGELMARIVMEE